MSQKATQSVKVTRGKDNLVKMSLSIAFDRAAIGNERTTLVFEGIGKAIAAVLTPEEAQQFVAKLEKAKRQLGCAK